MWAAVLDVSAHATWRSDLSAIERQPDLRGHEVWREVPRAAFGAGAPVTFETVETLKDRRLVRCVVDQDGPYGGCVTIEIIRRDDGAIVTIAEKFKVHSAWFRWTNTVAGRRDRLDAFLTDLGKKFGEEAPRIADLPKDLRDPPAPAAEAPPAEAPPEAPVDAPPAEGAGDPTPKEVLPDAPAPSTPAGPRPRLGPDLPPAPPSSP